MSTFVSTSSKHVYDPTRIWGQMAVDNQERVNFPRLRKERLERARQQMKENNLDALLLFDGNNIRYVTGLYDYGWRGLLRYCVLPRDGDPIMFEPVGPDMECTKNNAPWVKDLRPAIAWLRAASAEQFMIDRFAASVKKALSDYKVLDGEMGADLLDPGSAKALANAGIKVSPERGVKAMNEARMIKTQDELELLKEVCAMVDCAYWNLRNEWVKPGVRECELKGMISKFLLSLGCENYTGNCSSGSQASPYYRGGHTDKIVRAGDLIVFDIVPQYQGYWADFVRCWVVGTGKNGIRPSKEQKQVYRECYDSLQRAIKAVKPGATTSDIAKGFIEDEEAANRSTSLVNGGHSLGLWHQELPYVTKAYSIEYPEKIRQNMYMALETYVHSPDWKYSARLEENFVVTDTGAQPYSQFPFEEELLE